MKCARCKRSDLTADDFSVDRTRGGFQRWCKICVSEYKADLKAKEKRITAPHYQKEIVKAGPPTTYRTRNTQDRFLLIRSLIEKQDGRCPICQSDLGVKPVLDSDAETGKIRGLLCPPCRLGLEGFVFDVDRMKRAVKYVEANS